MSTSESTSPTPHATLVDAFRRDLRELPPERVVRKHITTGNPVHLGYDEYIDLKERIAGEFSVHPNSVVVVGSVRLGFTLKPKNRYRERKPVDIDVAIVSARLFASYWDTVFLAVRADPNWIAKDKGRMKFMRDLFQGWINPTTLPSERRFQFAQRWTNFFDGLTRTREFGIRKISGRLYKDWARLEAYQEIFVSQCQHAERKQPKHEEST